MTDRTFTTLAVQLGTVFSHVPHDERQESARDLGVMAKTVARLAAAGVVWKAAEFDVIVNVVETGMTAIDSAEDDKQRRCATPCPLRTFRSAARRSVCGIAVTHHQLLEPPEWGQARDWHVWPRPQDVSSTPVALPETCRYENSLSGATALMRWGPPWSQ